MESPEEILAEMQPRRARDQQLERIAEAAREAVAVQNKWYTHNHWKDAPLYTAVSKMGDALAALSDVEAGATLTHAEVATNNQMLREAAERIDALVAQLASKQRLLSDTYETIQPMRLRCVQLQKALEALLDAVENDGTLIHSDRCGCDVCEALSKANGVVDAIETPAPKVDREEMRSMILARQLQRLRADNERLQNSLDRKIEALLQIEGWLMKFCPEGFVGRAWLLDIASSAINAPAALQENAG